MTTLESLTTRQNLLLNAIRDASSMMTSGIEYLANAGARKYLLARDELARVQTLIHLYSH